MVEVLLVKDKGEMAHGSDVRGDDKVTYGLIVRHTNMISARVTLKAKT